MKIFSFVDPLVTRWMAKHGINVLRYSVGVIFIWFGGLKFIPELSPAEHLALSTIEVLTFNLIPAHISLLFLALFEVMIGLLLISGTYLRLTIFLLLVQMGGTMSPIFIFPELVFAQIPFVLTIEGQYIFKNFVVISAALVIGATVRGGRLTSEPQQLQPG
ncbi:MAG: hypothetical protein JJU13_15505 [Balneolaceae bacterium]|nr:hypothetical protein [Balneolaceae bacterium]